MTRIPTLVVMANPPALAGGCSVMPKNIRDGFIGKGDLIAHLDKNDISIVNGYTCNEHVSWLLVSCWYNIVPNGALGSIWVADNRFIYLGCHSSLTEDQKQYMINKLDNLNET